MKKEDFMRKAVGTSLLCLMMTGQASAVPIITFYKKQGESKRDCDITMTNGTKKLTDHSCTNDDDYYFSITGAEDGVSFGIYNSGKCDTDESYAVYKMKVEDHETNRDIPMTAVDASVGLKADEEIKKLLYSGGKGKSGKLKGKVSCLKVWGRVQGTSTDAPPQ